MTRKTYNDPTFACCCCLTCRRPSDKPPFPHFLHQPEQCLFPCGRSSIWAVERERGSVLNLNKADRDMADRHGEAGALPQTRSGAGHHGCQTVPAKLLPQTLLAASVPPGRRPPLQAAFKPLGTSRCCSGAGALAGAVSGGQGTTALAQGSLA